MRNIKNRFKLNKLIIYVLFKHILFVSLYHIRTKKFKKNVKFRGFFIIFDFLS